MGKAGLCREVMIRRMLNENSGKGFVLLEGVDGWGIKRCESRGGRSRAVSDLLELPCGGMCRHEMVFSEERKPATSTFLR